MCLGTSVAFTHTSSFTSKLSIKYALPVITTASTTYHVILEDNVELVSNGSDINTKNMRIS